jgi:hypothetical protein
LRLPLILPGSGKIASCGSRSSAHGERCSRPRPGGNSIGVLLFVKEGYLDDVEIYSNEGSTIAGLPVPSALKLSERSQPDPSGARYLTNP